MSISIIFFFVETKLPVCFSDHIEQQYGTYGTT